MIHKETEIYARACGHNEFPRMYGIEPVTLEGKMKLWGNYEITAHERSDSKKALLMKDHVLLRLPIGNIPLEHKGTGSGSTAQGKAHIWHEAAYFIAVVGKYSTPTVLDFAPVPHLFQIRHITLAAHAEVRAQMELDGASYAVRKALCKVIQLWKLTFKITGVEHHSTVIAEFELWANLLRCGGVGLACKNRMRREKKKQKNEGNAI